MGAQSRFNQRCFPAGLINEWSAELRMAVMTISPEPASIWRAILTVLRRNLRCLIRERQDSPKNLQHLGILHGVREGLEE